MQVFIFDVEHGFCAAVVSPNGKLLLIDCGHNASTGWRPSAWVASLGVPIEELIVTNADEDHVSDLPQLNARCDIKSLLVNPMSADWIRNAKWDTHARWNGIGPGIQALIEMIPSPGYLPHPPIDWGGMTVACFSHPTTLFTDTNNLSVVTFVSYAGLRMIFPGDLTKQAWGVFLADRQFVSLLNRCNVFVAAHHGREDGYAPAVFDRGLTRYRPELVIVSDKERMYDTQEVDYSRHAIGISWNGGRETRSTLTTRNDGALTITATAESYYVEALG